MLYLKRKNIRPYLFSKTIWRDKRWCFFKYKISVNFNNLFSYSISLMSSSQFVGGKCCQIFWFSLHTGCLRLASIQRNITISHFIWCRFPLGNVRFLSHCIFSTFYMENEVKNVFLSVELFFPFNILYCKIITRNSVIFLRSMF